MIERVFVANRGEIALRVVRACRALGLETVVGASDVDRDGMAARMADRSVVIGPAPAGESYLRGETIVQAALATGCDAIHPGYGFLSESPGFAALGAAAGLRFVGPRPEVIELVGDKLRARAAAAAAGIPLIPGREIEDVAGAEALAEEVGYPILLKAAAGGGGRGIKLVGERAELAERFAVARAEAEAAFDDPRLYAERFVDRARHIEVQIAADDRGTTIHLGERDCSTQRRYQKLVEESPAPLLPASVGEAIRAAGVAFAESVGYTNVGTVEFVYDAERGDFALLEMNCRIQVEHPVTEAVTGVDLVAEQLRLAAGEPLSLAQEELAIEGHAIEARLTAEDAERGFLPSPGRLTRFEVPALPGLRVDTHCEPGAMIPPHYDSLMAKLIAHGPDREAARMLLLEALSRVEVEGVATNRDLLTRILGSERFTAGEVTTRWLEAAIA